MNPLSGTASPSADELAATAREAGVEARDVPPHADVSALARNAVEDGFDVIGIAGGDGSIAPVAEVALEHDLPFVCVPFGTRNHFARDLGLECDDPIGALAAFRGEERRVDVGTVGGRVFVNNVSLGVYASLVHDPRHETKNRLVALVRMAPAAIGRSRRPLDLSFEVDGRRARHSALVALVGNNDYELGTLAEMGVRARLDEGLLHAYVVEAATRRTLLALLARAVAGRIGDASGWTEWAAPSFQIESKRRRIHAAVDGEPVVLESPLEFESRPRALRVLVPATVSRDGEGGADASR